jgi:hypothetical protein
VVGTFYFLSSTRVFWKAVIGARLPPGKKKCIILGAGERQGNQTKQVAGNSYVRVGVAISMNAFSYKPAGKHYTSFIPKIEGNGHV